MKLEQKNSFFPLLAFLGLAILVAPSLASADSTVKFTIIGDTSVGQPKEMQATVSAWSELPALVRIRLSLGSAFPFTAPTLQYLTPAGWQDAVITTIGDERSAELPVEAGLIFGDERTFPLRVTLTSPGMVALKFLIEDPTPSRERTLISDVFRFIVEPAPQPMVLGLSTSRFVQDLRYGMRSQEVSALQTELRTMSDVYWGPVTGYFGPLTRAGVRRYQKQNNLPQTGVLDASTRGLLNSQL